MVRRLYILLLVSLFSTSIGFGQTGSGTLKGKVIDTKTGKPVPFANVVVEKRGRQISGTSADINGKYVIKPLDPGKYTVRASYVGYAKAQITDVQVNSNKITFQDVKLTPSGVTTDTVVVSSYKEPLIDKDGGSSGGTVTDVTKIPGRDVSSLAKTVGGVYQAPGSGGLNIRGSRSNSTQVFIDGIKVRGSSNLPQSAIQEVSVITGGVPASYGDATGGIVSVSTKGPSQDYFGSVEAVTSGFKVGDNVYGLDSYGYNLLEGNVSGPIWTKKDSSTGEKKSLIGFLLSANYTHQVDPRPTAIPNWKIKDDVKDSLIANPLRRGTGTGAFYNAEFLQEDDFETVKWRQNAASNVLSVSGKLDFNTGELTNLTIGGNMNYNNRKGAPYNYSLMNYENNPEFTDLDWRVFGKFSQRFENPDEEEEGDATNLKNVFYQVQVDYSKETARREDATHGNNFFNYGYLGKFDTYRERSYEIDQQNGTREHTGWNDTLVTFEPSNVNERMAAITEQFYEIYTEPEGRYENFVQIQANNGLLNGEQPESVYDIWTNVGTRYNRYSRQNNSQFRITAKGSADLGDHALQLGFEYEQRTDRSYIINPVGLWTRARRLTNFHIEELDTDNPEYSQVGQYTQVDYQRAIGSDQAYFDKNLREGLGLDVNGRYYIDVDSLNPDELSIDYFGADELLNNGSNYVTYYGYDHTGELQSGNPTLEDFLYEENEDGVKTRPIDAYRPIYMAGYVMDKFSLDEIVFNVGLRVSRFDANQPVLKDKYLMQEAYTVSEKPDALGGHPASIDDDAVIYVDDPADPSRINGYRSGDNWFNAEGEPISDPSIIRDISGGQISPYLVDADQRVDGRKISENAFEDYEPQVNLLPRIAFSFNVRDDASFFAHYDVLARRPRSAATRFNPIDFFFVENRDVVISNPNLQPEKTIDYEVGFQKKLSNRSALKISAFYREKRNMVQITRVVSAYPDGYRTYGNLDFGTIKGITLKYDLRKRSRRDNISLRAYYTLQFAEGTGSDIETQESLINSDQPNLRTVSPLNFDQRHQFTITGDLSFAGGKAYNGPTIKGKKILQRTGLNLQSNFGSGTPYTALRDVVSSGYITGNVGSRSVSGGINGARKPWQFRVDAQLDRDIALKFGGKKEGQKPKRANLNVYLRVNNLFNNINVVSVYGKTGNPDDDGYLSAARFQRDIEEKRNEESFRNYYRMKINNPYNYGLPRTIRLGARIDF